MRTVLVSGGFDPIHIGHVRYIQNAALHGRVIVALNSDPWLMRKKGFVFMPFAERAAILQAITGVSEVWLASDDDNTVCESIRIIKPDSFAKGGDRGPSNTPEADLCREMGVQLIYGCGGGKIQSSSNLVERQWGSYEIIHESPICKVKVLRVKPGKALSLQSHEKRNEWWIDPSTNNYEYHAAGKKHQLKNFRDTEMTVIEVQTGDYFGEDDIVRYET